MQTIELPPNVSWDVQHWMSDSTYGWACVNNDSIFYRVSLADCTTVVPAPNFPEYPECPQSPAFRVLIFRSELHPNEPTVAVIDHEWDCYSQVRGYDRLGKIVLPSGDSFGPVVEFPAYVDWEANCGNTYSQGMFTTWPPPPFLAHGIVVGRTRTENCDGMGIYSLAWWSNVHTISPSNAGLLSTGSYVRQVSFFSRFDDFICATTDRFQLYYEDSPCYEPEGCCYWQESSHYHRISLNESLYNEYCSITTHSEDINDCVPSFPTPGSCGLHEIAAQRDSSGTERVMLSNGECHDPVSFDLLWQNPAAQGNPVYAARMFDSPDERILVWTNGGYFNVFNASDGSLLSATSSLVGSPVYLLKQPNQSSEIVTYEALTRTVRIYRSMPDSLPQCPFPEPPLVEDFDEPVLDTCWYWVNEDSTHWNLDARPGWLRINTQATPDVSHIANILLRARTLSPCRIETALDFQPDTDGESAGILLALNTTNYLLVQKIYWGSPFVALTVYAGDSVISNQMVAVDNGVIHLRLEWLNRSLAGFGSDDGLNWHFVGHAVLPWISHNNVKMGLFATNGQNQEAGEIPADFDNFSLQSIPGTPVAEVVSGTWTAQESPYIILSNTFVHSGNVLTIEPGTIVQFTGPYYLGGSSGRIYALGTETDSIYFTRAYPAQSSAGKGIHFTCCNDVDTSYFDYCVFEEARSPNYWEAGLYVVDEYAIEMSHCTFRNNNALSGGVVNVYWPNHLKLSDCRFEGNTAGSGGGLSVIWNNAYAGVDAVVERCVFANNHASFYGGGVYIFNLPAGEAVSLRQCTFYNNSAVNGGADLYAEDSAAVTSSIFWSDSAGERIQGSASVSFSNILGGYPGIGNIDSDPLFVNANGGDFHLSANSPCINSGDPDSPPNPDGSRADMGAIPYDGQFIAQPLLLAEPSTLDFGPMVLGDSATLSFDLINPAGISAVIAGRNQIAPVFSHTLALDAVIGADDTLTISVTGHALSESEIHEVFEIRYWLDRLETLRVDLILSVPPVPAAPESLTVYRSGNNIVLRWQPVTESMGGEPLTPSLYVIHASLSESGPFIPIGSSITTSFVHEDIIPAQAIYFYRITATSP